MVAGTNEQMGLHARGLLCHGIPEKINIYISPGQSVIDTKKKKKEEKTYIFLKNNNIDIFTINLALHSWFLLYVDLIL